MASSTSTPLQWLLRASLLGGTLLDAVLLLIVAAPFFRDSGALPPVAVSYSWLLWPALAGRAGIQAFACYDRRRYDQAIPWLALTLVATGGAAWRHGDIPAALVAAYGLLGTLQLIAWRRTR